MLTEGNAKTLGLVNQISQIGQAMSSELKKLEQHEWYSDIIYFLQNRSCPNHLVNKKRRALRLKASKYCII